MKKIALVVAVAFLTFNSKNVNASAKDNMHFGIQAHFRPTIMAGFDKVAADNKAPGVMKTLNLIGGGGALFFDYDFHPYVGVQAEIAGGLSGGKFKNKTTNATTKLTLISAGLNLLGNINVLGDSSLKVQVGAGVPFLLSKKLKNGTTEDANLKNRVKAFDIKGIFGVEYIYPAWGVGAGLRFDIGLLGYGKGKTGGASNPKYREVGLALNLLYDFSNLIRA